MRSEMRTAAVAVMLAIALAAPACGSTASGPAATGGRDASDGVDSASTGGTASCLKSDRGSGNIDVQLGAATYWQADPTRVSNVTIWLRGEMQAPVAACAGMDAADARCVARDTTLQARQQENARQITCALDGLGSRLTVIPVWYEVPFHLTSGQPVPVLLAFRVGLDWSQIERAATNPLVSRIDPSPGEAAVAGFIPPVPAECPSSGGRTPATDAKLTDIASIEGKGRQPVVIETVDKGLLPAMVACNDSGPCAAAVNSEWERTILNTREITCLKRRMDQVVVGSSPAVPYGSFYANSSVPPLPPLGVPATTLKAFGAGLTIDEARQLAEHPYVERLWTSSAIEFRQPVAGCPPDLTSPIPITVCPAERTSIAGKLSESAQLKFSTAGATAFDVMILVAGGAQHCPLPECSQVPCPAREAVQRRWAAENLEAQRCVRALVDSVGGTSNVEVFAITNVFEATLNWEQIQIVAQHPHVLQIDPNEPTPPP
ncbi:MAG TPA: hypothetical protein VFH73_24050 [Polyangia bacterium]|nr:hypothetical protein [Polyangia bacterium]